MLRDIWERRWNWFHRPIHAVAHLLHPMWLSERQSADMELGMDWLRYLDGVARHFIDIDVVETQYIAFKRQVGVFGHHAALNPRRRERAVTWWNLYGSACPTLQKLALRVLSQVFLYPPNSMRLKMGVRWMELTNALF